MLYVQHTFKASKWRIIHMDKFNEIKKWTMQEQIFKLELPKKENVDWAIELNYPFKHPQPISIVVLNPVNKDFIVLQIAMQMSPQHQQALAKKGNISFAIFYNRLKVELLKKDVSYNINQKAHKWILTDQIYYDGLTKHEFFKTIRKLHNSAILGNMMIDEVVHMAIIPQAKKGKPGKGPNSTGGGIYS